MTEPIAKRFVREIADHRMTVLHDDGLYRHLRFRSAGSSLYWFDLITVPGSLIFRGDGQSFVFARLRDMFEFFRGPVGRINPQYWAEKLTSCREEGVKRYDREIFEAKVKESTAEAIRARVAPPGLAKAVRTDLLDSDYTWTEEEARETLQNFGHSIGFQFHDTWEWDFRDYDWWFLWACHAIVWGIAQYDAQTSLSPVVATVGPDPAQRV
jgi:hypothetical protein